MARLLLIVALFFTPSIAHSFMQIGSDFFPSLTILGFNFKSHNYVHFGGQGFALGPVVQYERFHDSAFDVITAGGVRMGHEFFLEIDGGYFARIIQKPNRLVGRGIGVIAMLGWQLTGGFRIALPFVYKQILNGLAKRSTLTVVPYIGLRLVL